MKVSVGIIGAGPDVAVALVSVKAERNGQAAAFPEFREYQGDEQTEDRFWS